MHHPTGNADEQSSYGGIGDRVSSPYGRQRPRIRRSRLAWAELVTPSLKNKIQGKGLEAYLKW